MIPLTPMKEIWDKLDPKNYQVLTTQFTIGASGQSDAQQIDFGGAYNFFITGVNFDVYDKTATSGTRILPTSSTVDPILVNILIGTSYQLVSGTGGVTIWQFNDMWKDNYVNRGWKAFDRYLNVTLSHVAINTTARYTFPLTIYMKLEGYKLDGQAR